MEFVPKTLADLNIDGISTDGSLGLNNGRSHPHYPIGSTHGSNQNLSTHNSSNNNSNLRHSSSIGNLSSKQPAWSVHNPRMSNSSASFNERRTNNGSSNNNSNSNGGVRRDDPFSSGWDNEANTPGVWGARGAQSAASAAMPPPSRPLHQQNRALDPWSGDWSFTFCLFYLLFHFIFDGGGKNESGCLIILLNCFFIAVSWKYDGTDNAPIILHFMGEPIILLKINFSIRT